jgi:hypothetical protein
MMGNEVINPHKIFVGKRRDRSENLDEGII